MRLNTQGAPLCVTLCHEVLALRDEGGLGSTQALWHTQEGHYLWLSVAQEPVLLLTADHVDRFFQTEASTTLVAVYRTLRRRDGF